MRFLGICITENIKWDAQVQSLSSKVSKISYVIKSLKETMSPYVIRNIYYTNFQSCLRYIILWVGMIMRVKTYMNWGGGHTKIILETANVRWEDIHLYEGCLVRFLGASSTWTCGLSSGKDRVKKSIDAAILLLKYLFISSSYTRKYAHILYLHIWSFAGENNLPK